MISHSFLILLLFSPLAISQYSYPNLGINTDSPNCNNVRSLITYVNTDQSRIQKLVDSDIPNSITNLNTVKSFTTTACSLSANLRTLKSFLQLKSTATFLKEMKSFEEKTNVLRSSSNLFDMLIGDRVDKLTVSLSQITQTSAQNIVAKCNAIEIQITDLLNYLSFLINETRTRYFTNNFFSTRLSTLNTKLIECSTTSYSNDAVFDYDLSNDPFANDARSERYKDYTINFATTFNEYPRFAVAIKGYDTAYATSSIAIYVSITGVYKNYATIRVVVGAGCSLTRLELSYIAATKYSGLYIAPSTSINTASDNEVYNLFVNGQGTRDINRRVTYDNYYDNNGNLLSSGSASSSVAMAFLAGVYADVGTNARITVFMNDINTMTFRTYEDSKIRNVVGVTIAYDETYQSIKSGSRKSTPGGPLYSKSTESLGYIDYSAFAQNPTLFWGLYHIDMVTGATPSLKSQVLNRSDRKYEVIYSAYAAQFWQIIGSYIITCPRINDGCLK